MFVQELLKPASYQRLLVFCRKNCRVCFPDRAIARQEPWLKRHLCRSYQRAIERTEIFIVMCNILSSCLLPLLLPKDRLVKQAELIFYEVV
ncbi:MAG: hypothetical protein JGK24_16390 [Microcoleus sp. PH2017_29_MFU_D_A]|jgi:hypothetical protein|uniref:hypothetical protein n=1 Tax=unclassified Microcoleus TaxID=2642155 RepID=UPI001E0A9C6C|nr:MULTISPECIES: hypothetical protein [unclassified Microcoleus]MCC3419497.1 hypothetical protein [Microcoleus sp. PH2017_07_MST_O_A]MCC3506402.1 hypothetical protein [Microcoleus sp. PH2017_19_SFW_U_A]MCC3426381.1 hypothetical protein [Microcoleus sp. PH2017_01_SCD_O_A]MCC3474721.1 hypothetical protein [Microcoleus sp. PH2017_13_LAR_U_A]MCC3487221.1 hypothetical protein [Microcoleus sp. PH2017_14_LAR_D_A]